MTYYDVYILLNFGFDITREPILRRRSGSQRFSEETGKHGRTRYYHKGSTASALHVVEIFVSNEFQWTILKQRGIKRILSNYTPSGKSKFIILAHGSPHNSNTMSSFEKMSNKGGKTELTYFSISIIDIAQLIANSIAKAKFNDPNNFFAITLWSCLTGAVTALPIHRRAAEVFVAELRKRGICTRVRAPMTKLSLYYANPPPSKPKTPRADQKDLWNADSANASVHAKTGYFLTPDATQLNPSVSSTSSSAGSGTLSDDSPIIQRRIQTIDPTLQIFVPAIMLLFMLDDKSKVVCCLPRAGSPFMPQGGLRDSELIAFLGYLTEVIKIILNAMHYSTIDTLEVNDRQVWLERLRRIQNELVYTQNFENANTIANTFVLDLQRARLITDVNFAFYHRKLNRAYSAHALHTIITDTDDERPMSDDDSDASGDEKDPKEEE